MRTMIGMALDLGWPLWAYEDQIRITPETDRAWLLSLEYTNMRERGQAANLGRLIEAAPGEPLLVWCGNGHATKDMGEDDGDVWVPMGRQQLVALTGEEPDEDELTGTLLPEDGA
jgi:hypothetical protein